MGPTLTACNSLPCRCSTIDRQEGSAINHENFHCYLTCSNKQNQQNLSQTERLRWQQCGPNGQTLLVSDTQGPNLIVFGNGWASVASAAKRARVKNNHENFHCYFLVGGSFGSNGASSVTFMNHHVMSPAGVLDTTPSSP